MSSFGHSSNRIHNNIHNNIHAPTSTVAPTNTSSILRLERQQLKKHHEQERHQLIRMKHIVLLTDKLLKKMAKNTVFAVLRFSTLDKPPHPSQMSYLPDPEMAAVWENAVDHSAYYKALTKLQRVRKMCIVQTENNVKWLEEAIMEVEQRIRGLQR